jgi:hypothetical protein
VQEARSEGPPLFKASAVSSPWMPPTGSCDGQFFVVRAFNNTFSLELRFCHRIKCPAILNRINFTISPPLRGTLISSINDVFLTSKSKMPGRSQLPPSREYFRTESPEFCFGSCHSRQSSSQLLDSVHRRNWEGCLRPG